MNYFYEKFMAKINVFRIYKNSSPQMRTIVYWHIVIEKS